MESRSDGRPQREHWALVEGLEPRRLLSSLPVVPFGAPGWNGGAPVSTDFHAQFGFYGAAFKSQAVLSDGSVLAAGGAITRGDTGILDRFLVVKYRPDGTLDTRFGTGGQVTLSPSKILFGFDSARTFQEVDAVTAAPDGKILLGGRVAFTRRQRLRPVRASQRRRLARHDVRGRRRQLHPAVRRQGK